MKRFVVMSDIVGTEDMGKLTEVFRSKGFGWARYFSGAWLIAVADNSITTMELCKQIMATIPGKDVMVIETPGGPAWAFWMSNAELTGSLKEWLSTHWGL